MKDLLILGAGGLGREVAWLVERINSVTPQWNLIGFLDDNEELLNRQLNGYGVAGNISDAARFEGACFVCAIGAEAVRERIVNKVRTICPECRFATLIDPSAIISDFVSIGEGTVIFFRNSITVNISIGDHVIINPGCTIGHDAVLDDFVTLYPSVNISGNTRIGRCAEMGTGTQIIQGKTVGERSIIGAGAVVVRDIPANCTAVGIPAKPIKFH